MMRVTKMAIGSMGHMECQCCVGGFVLLSWLLQLKCLGFAKSGIGKGAERPHPPTALRERVSSYFVQPGRTAANIKMPSRGPQSERGCQDHVARAQSGRRFQVPAGYK